MNLAHLHYFYVVAKENGFTKASQVLRVNQGALSRTVKMLGEDLGVTLFEKVGRHVRLTPQGQEVFDHCWRIFGEVEGLKAAVGQIRGECKGPLMIGASEPIASHFFPEILERYLAQHPKVHPNLFSGPANLMFSQILTGELELGAFFHIPDLPEALEIFERKPVRYHLVISKERRRRKETLETFIGSREIDDTSTRRFPTLERLRRDHPEAKIKISSNNLTAHREMVRRGLGVSILPDFLVREDLREGVLAEVYPKEDFIFDLKFVKRKTAVLSLNAREWIKESLVSN